MSSGNDENKLVLLILSCVLGGLALLVYAAVIFFVIGAVFLTIGITIQCLWAWFTPRNYDGDILYPHQARSIIYYGLFTAVFSAFGIPIIFAMADNPLDFAEVFWPLAAVGYAFGVLLRAYDVEKSNEAEKAQAEIVEHQVPTPALSAPPAKKNIYANWDDEEEFGK